MVNRSVKYAQEPDGAVVGNKILFAGGTPERDVPSSIVDVYDASEDKWRVAQLSINRVDCMTATAGNTVFFAGGISDFEQRYSLKTIDVYDAAANIWSTVELSEARGIFAMGSAGKKIVIAGGSHRDGTVTKTVDIFTVN